MTTRHIHTYCAMCISRCGVIATVEDGKLAKVSVDPEHPNGCICVKGTAAPEIVYSPDRVRYPMVRTRPKGDPDPGWRRLSWDEAMAMLTSKLRAIKDLHGSEAAIFGYATPRGTATSDFSLWVQRLANAFGTPNILNSVHTCHWNREYGSRYTYGVRSGFPGTGFPLPDYEEARSILLWGFNPQATWPGAAKRLNRARERGAKIIMIDPRTASNATKADIWLRVRPGGDEALAMSMIHVLLEEALHDDGFVREWTNAAFLVRDDTGNLLVESDLIRSGDPDTYLVWDEYSDRCVRYRADHGFDHEAVVPALAGAHAFTIADGKTVTARPALEALRAIAMRYAPERAEGLTWVPASEVRRAVRTFAREQPSCYFSWVGLEQHHNAAQMNRAICIFYALTGQIDSRGSNVYFAATPTHPIAGRELLPAHQAAKRLGVSERPLGPAHAPGFVQAYHVFDAILTQRPYPIHGLVMFGGDVVLANGNPLRSKAALEALGFYAHVDMFINPSAAMADLILPATTCWEREGLMPSFDVAADTMTWAQLRAAMVQPMYESRPELDVIFDLATRLELGEQFFHGDVEAGLTYQLAPAGVTPQQLRDQPMGVRVATQTRYRKHAEIDDRTGRARGFTTPTRKIEIYSTAFARAGHAALPGGVTAASARAEPTAEYPLLLTFFRTVQYCDASHRNIARLRRVVPDPVVEIHPATAEALNLQDGEWVHVESVAGSVRLKARFNAFLHPGVVCTQYGWWQDCQALGLPGYDPLAPDGANANLLTANDAIDPISGSVGHRSQPCRVRKEDMIR